MPTLAWHPRHYNENDWRWGSEDETIHRADIVWHPASVLQFAPHYQWTAFAHDYRQGQTDKTKSGVDENLEAAKRKAEDAVAELDTQAFASAFGATDTKDIIKEILSKSVVPTR